MGQHVKRTQVRTVEYKQESTAATTTKNPQWVKRAWPIEKSIANCRKDSDQDEVQDKDQDEAKFKISVGIIVRTTRTPRKFP